LPVADPYAPAVMLTRTSDRLSRSSDGLRRLLGQPVPAAMQLACNTIDVADCDEGRAGASASTRTDDAYETGGPNSERGRAALELVLRVRCTQPDLIMFRRRT